MSKQKRNQFADNPHHPGTVAAAGWDLSEASRRFYGTASAAFQRDAETILAPLRRKTGRPSDAHRDKDTDAR